MINTEQNPDEHLPGPVNGIGNDLDVPTSRSSSSRLGAKCERPLPSFNAASGIFGRRASSHVRCKIAIPTRNKYAL